MLRLLLLPACAVAMTGCAVPHPQPVHDSQQTEGLVYAAIGKTASVNGPRVTPLALLEDSRCPPSVRCVWAGQVRVQVRIDLGSGSHTAELKQGVPIAVADGTLELVTVGPGPADGGIKPQAYRFGFRFRGGL